MDKMREEFEAWANTSSLKNFLFWHPSDNRYEVHAVQMAFWGWQASRAALCVELPSFENGSLRGYSGDCEEARMVVDAIAESLEKAGVSYE